MAPPRANNTERSGTPDSVLATPVAAALRAGVSIPAFGRKNGRLRRWWRAAAPLLAFAAVSLLPPAARAKNEFLEMDLDELLRADVVALDTLGTHIHHRNELMISYRFTFMRMSGLRSGGSSLTSSDVLKSFMVAPTDMPCRCACLG